MSRFPPALLLAAALAAGCGTDRSPAPVTAAPAAAPSRPTATAASLVTLERQDGQFGIHDTLTVARDGTASLLRAHGGGGFRKEACRLGAPWLHGLARDLRRLPVDGPGRPVPGAASLPRSHGVIIARPPQYAVTYRGRHQVFGGATMPADGAPLAARLERVLTAREGRCRTTFHRP